jgi:hypothetical protein
LRVEAQVQIVHYEKYQPSYYGVLAVGAAPATVDVP